MHIVEAGFRVSQAIMRRLDGLLGGEQRLAARTEAWLAAKFGRGSRRLRGGRYA